MRLRKYVPSAYVMRRQRCNVNIMMFLFSEEITTILSNERRVRFILLSPKKIFQLKMLFNPLKTIKMNETLYSTQLR